MAGHRIYTTSVASVYPHYITKAEKKGRTKDEVDTIFRWLTGYSQQQLDTHLEKRTDFETFFAQAPRHEPVADADHRGGLRRAGRGGGGAADARDPLSSTS